MCISLLIETVAQAHPILLQNTYQEGWGDGFEEELDTFVVLVVFGEIQWL